MYHPVPLPGGENDILRGVCSALNYVGINGNNVAANGILKQGEIGFFIPQKIY
jgi:hypothetical protein